MAKEDDFLPTLAELEVRVRDPYPDWRERRQRCPVEVRDAFGRTQATVFTRDETFAVLKDEESFSARVNQESMGPYMGSVLLGKDGKEHTTYRNLVSHAFRRSALERWEAELIRPEIEALLDVIAPLGRADLVRDVTSRYPVKVITSRSTTSRASRRGPRTWPADRFARSAASPRRKRCAST